MFTGARRCQRKRLYRQFGDALHVFWEKGHGRFFRPNAVRRGARAEFLHILRGVLDKARRQPRV
eukprot:6786235-Lingulodinium_polyedra.AAC.1